MNKELSNLKKKVDELENYRDNDNKVKLLWAISQFQDIRKTKEQVMALEILEDAINNNLIK